MPLATPLPRQRRGALSGAIVILVLAGLIGACELLSFDDHTDVPARIEMQRTKYAVGDSVAGTIHVGSHRRLYFRHCCGRIAFVVERRQKARWTAVHHVNGLCPAICAGTPVALQPSSQRRFSVTVVEAGTYRLGLPYGTDARRVAEQVYSREFIVE